MQTKIFSATALKFAKLQTLAIAIQSGSKTEIIDSLESLRTNPDFQGKAWRANFAKLRTVFEDNGAVFSVFALGGNSKLPFVAFSTLPGVTCPGAGACLDFCYSYRAWRYPAAFARQAQNAYLLRFNAAAVRERFETIATTRPDGFDFRLYVDGDFSSAADLEFWMDTIRANPAARAYGYSKSFTLFLQYSGVFPRITF